MSCAQKIYWNRICEVTTLTYPLVTLDSVVFFFETILYTSKKYLMGTISSRISHQLRDIYSICRCRWNVVSNTYWLYIWATWRVSYKRKDLLILHGHLCWWGPFSSFFIVCVVQLCVYTFLVPCCDFCYDFRKKTKTKTKTKQAKTMFNSSLPPVVCRRDHVLF